MSTAISQTHKALVSPKQGGEFGVADVPTSPPGPGQILVKAQSIALNPADWKINIYRPLDHYPAIYGFDMTGDVVEVGEGVTRFVKGDRVLGQTSYTANKLAGFQQYIVKDAATACKIPDGFTYDEAAPLPLSVGTSISGLYSEVPHGAGLVAPLTPETEGFYAGKGKAIVILGGSSSVGQTLIQLSKLSGLSPIITTASGKHEEHVKSLGATHVLDRNLSDGALVSAAKSIVGDKPIEVVIDSISAKATQKLGASMLNQGGTLVLLLKPEIDEAEFKGINISETYASWVSPWNVELFRSVFGGKLTEWLKDGKLKSSKYEVVPNGLAGIPAGLKRIQNNQVSGFKLLVHPQETV